MVNQIKDRWFRSELGEIGLYIFLVIFVAFIAPILIGFIGKAFSESFVQGQPLTFGSYLANYTIYIPFLIVAICLIFFPIMRLIYLKRNEHPAEKKPMGFMRIFTVSYIHNPEESGLWELSNSLGYKKKRNFMGWAINVFRVLIISILVFGLYGILQVAHPQLTVSAVPQLQLQQFSQSAEVTFGSFVPAIAENGFILFIFFILLGIGAYFSNKLNFGKGGYYSIGIIACIVVAFLWRGLHGLVYVNSELSLWVTFFFAFVGCLITLLVGSLIPFFVWHVMNNVFVKLSELITLKEDIMLVAGIIWFLIFLVWISIELLYSKYKKKKQAQQVSIPEG